MVKNVIKRDGRIKDFDIQYINNAVKKAYKEVYHDEAKFIEYIGFIDKDLAVKLSTKAESISIEDIQDIVIEALKTYDKNVAKS